MKKETISLSIIALIVGLIIGGFFFSQRTIVEEGLDGELTEFISFSISETSKVFAEGSAMRYTYPSLSDGECEDKLKEDNPLVNLADCSISSVGSNQNQRAEDNDYGIEEFTVWAQCLCDYST